jgi:hypothetical protein
LDILQISDLGLKRAAFISHAAKEKHNYAANLHTLKIDTEITLQNQQKEESLVVELFECIASILFIVNKTIKKHENDPD